MTPSRIKNLDLAAQINEGMLAWQRHVAPITEHCSRKICPEMTEPQCASCAMDPVCDHRKGMFQPVLRTSFY